MWKVVGQILLVIGFLAVVPAHNRNMLLSEFKKWWEGPGVTVMLYSRQFVFGCRELSDLERLLGQTTMIGVEQTIVTLSKPTVPNQSPCDFLPIQGLPASYGTYLNLQGLRLVREVGVLSANPAYGIDWGAEHTLGIYQMRSDQFRPKFFLAIFYQYPPGTDFPKGYEPFGYLYGYLAKR